MTPRRLVLALLLSVSCLTRAAAQPPQPSALPLPARWLQGYARTVAGDWIAYPWAYPGQTRTLLSRATSGQMAVDWEGEPVPAGTPGEQVTYLWHAGTASGYGAHRFSFSVNGRLVATFTSGRTTDDREWTVRGEAGSTLSFRATRVGQFNELFGFMWLTAPRTLFGSAAPRFRVVGQAAGSQDYYLGPQETVESWTRVRPEEALFRDGQRGVRVAISNVGPPSPVRVRSGERVLWSGRVESGYTTLIVRAGPNIATTVAIAVAVGDTPTFDGRIVVAPVRPRAVHLLPHSHVDIGYSDPQPEVERKQWKNIRDAVALGTRTATYPPDARFKWNVEGMWSVESYLAQAPSAERQAFADTVRAGTIGLQANLTNILTGLARPEELRRWTDASRRVRVELGVGPIQSAMHSDIPGLSWTVVAALASSGVRYFSSGPNYVPGMPDGGDRIGGTLRALGDKPFWWTSPSGEERLLFWMAGHGYSWFHGLNTGAASERSRDALLDYVRTLVDEGYRYDMIQVRYTVGGDNGPVDPNLPDYVRRWNEEFASPRLVINTADAMFAEFERRHGAELPVMSGDMTPYWEDGAISSAAEEALVRAASRRLQQAETLAALRGVALPATAVDAAWRNVLLWREHTWGAADSISQPDRPDVVAQWEYKRRFATGADRQSRAMLETALPEPASAAPHIDIVNTLAWRRSGLALLSPDQSRDGDRVVSGDAPLASQRLRDGRLAVWVENVPPLSSVRLRVVADAPEAPAHRVVAIGNALDNGRVRLVVDADRGAVSSLSWAGAPGHNFAAGDSGLFHYLYLDGRDPAEAVASRGGTLTIEDAGPLVATLRIESPAGGARSSVRRFRLVAGAESVLAEVELDKIPVRTKESAHVAFPFNVPDGVIRVDQGEALVEIERDQLPGSCRDFVGVQSAIDVSGASLGVSLISLDSPLIELGALTDERQNDRGARSWRERVSPGTTLHAYLLNNYWHTNYKADQAGLLSFRFVVQPHGPFDRVAVRRLSDEHDFPLLVRSVGADHGTLAAPFTLEGDLVTLSSLRVVDSFGTLEARLFNPSSTSASIIVRPAGANTVIRVVGPARTRPATGGRVTLPPRSTRVVRLSSP